MRNAINLLLICCCTMTAFAREEYRRDFRKTVAWSGGRTVRIENSNGKVNIHTQSKGEVEIQAAIRCSANTASEARSFAEQIQIVVGESGGVSVRTQYPSNYNNRNLSYSVDYDIAMPETAPLDLRNRFGSVTVINLHAPATISSGNGAVHFSGGRGRQQIENSFGDVEVRTTDGPFAETREQLGGYDLIEAKDLDQAITIAARVPSAKFGSIEIRPVRVFS